MRWDRYEEDEPAPEAVFTPFRFEKEASRDNQTEVKHNISFFKRILTLAPLAVGIWLLYETVPRLLEDPSRRFIGFVIILAVYGFTTLLFWAVLDDLNAIDWEIVNAIVVLVTHRRSSTSDQPAPIEEDSDWDSIESLAGIDYYEYLVSEAWEERRNFMLRRAGYRCQICNSNEALEVHHRTYERLGEEFIEDLTVLCHECHSTFHKSNQLEI